MSGPSDPHRPAPPSGEEGLTTAKQSTEGANMLPPHEEQQLNPQAALFLTSAAPSVTESQPASFSKHHSVHQLAQHAALSSVTLADAADNLPGPTAYTSTDQPPQSGQLAVQQLTTAVETPEHMTSAPSSPDHFELPERASQQKAPGTFIALLQEDECTDLEREHAASTRHAPAAEPMLPDWPHAVQQSNGAQQQQQQQQRQATGINHMSGPDSGCTLLDPSHRAEQLFTSPRIVSPADSTRAYPSQSAGSLRKRSTRPKSSRRHRLRSKRLCTADDSVFLGVRCHWQTLGDVLQDIDINDITIKGFPLNRGTEVSAVAGPPTPMYSPPQIVDTRPLAYLHLLSQESHIPSSKHSRFRPPATYTMGFRGSTSGASATSSAAASSAGAASVGNAITVSTSAYTPVRPA